MKKPAKYRNERSSAIYRRAPRYSHVPANVRTISEHHHRMTARTISIGDLLRDILLALLVFLAIVALTTDYLSKGCTP